jgi:dolichyl-diphosphooligosaccharide--protein glycosyltransferase
MSDVRESVESLLAERPGLAEDIAAIREVDEGSQTWTFDDIPVDSGTFGELVSAGVVEKVDGEYRLADPDAVAVALGEETATSDAESRDFGSLVPEVDVGGLSMVGLTMLAVALLRVYVYPQIFRGSRVFFMGNDPYYYRHFLRELVRDGAAPFVVPRGIRFGEPLFVSVVWGVAAMLGGTESIAYAVLAWYPVFAAVATAALIYVAAVELTADHRVALASVVFLAVTPIHAYRSMVGYGDHHAFDALWLSLTVAALFVLLKADVSRERWVTVREASGAAAVAVGVAGQALAWEAGPLLFLPLVVFGGTWALVSVADEESILRTLAWVIVGTGAGAVVTLAAHVLFEWQTLPVAAAPAILCAGLAAVATAGEVGRRSAVDPMAVRGGVLVAGFLVAAVVWTVAPDVGAEVANDFLGLVSGSDQGTIAETRSLFSGALGSVVAPVFFFGFGLFFALPIVGWALYDGARSRSPTWYLFGCYGAVLLLLSVFQVRFAFHLSVVVTVGTAVAFVHLFSVIGESAPPAVFTGGRARTLLPSVPSRPARSELWVVAAVFVLVGGPGLLMTPLQANLLIHSDAEYAAVTNIEGSIDERGLEYPETYVLSQWDVNRLYNAFANGRSQTYTFARSHYPEFLSSPAGTDWYGNHSGRVGFVVTEDAGIGSGTVYEQLHKRYGSRVGEAPAMTHYRAIYRSDDGSLKVFELVPGTTVTGTASPNTTFEVSVQPTAADGQRYTRTVRSNRFGIYTFTVPYAGEYSVGEDTAEVTVTSIREGRRIAFFDGPGQHYWSFDERTGDRAHDRWGGAHGELNGPAWTEGVDGGALQFGEGDTVSVPPVSFDDGEPWAVSLWVRPDSLRDNQILLSDGNLEGRYLMLSKKSFVQFRDSASQYSQVGLSTNYADRWIHLVVTVDADGYVHVYENGAYRGRMRPASTDVTFRRIAWAGGRQFNGRIDELRVYGHNLSSSDAEGLYANKSR